MVCGGWDWEVRGDEGWARKEKKDENERDERVAGWKGWRVDMSEGREVSWVKKGRRSNQAWGEEGGVGGGCV